MVVGQENWITLEEQQNRFMQSMIEPITGTADSPGVIHVNAVAYIVAEFAISKNFINWYVALKRLGLDFKTPPIRSVIYQILPSPCRIDPNRTIDETHSLYLIPPGSIYELEQRVKAYGEAHTSEYEGENPFQFRGGDAIKKLHHETPHDEPQWRLIPNEILKDSYYKTFYEHMKMVEDLNKKSLFLYTISSLKVISIFVFFHKIATGITILEKRPAERAFYGFSGNCTCVLEQNEDRQVVVGTYNMKGLLLNSHDNRHACDYVGVMPMGIL